MKAAARPFCARLLPYRLTLSPPVVTAHGSFDTREGYWLCLAHEELSGLGEAAPWPTCGTPMAEVEACLHRATAFGSPLFEALPGNAGEVARVLERLELCPEAAHAVEVASLDLLAQREGRPLMRVLGPARERVLIHATVASVEAASAAVFAGARHLKIKIGARPLADDVALLFAIREEVGKDVAMQADANGAWDLATARAAIDALSPVDLAFIEQPLPPGALAEHAELRRRGRVKIALDESVRTPIELMRAIEAEAADVIVVKPMLAGGLCAAHKLAAAAHAARLAVTVTSVFESAAGRAAAAHLAAALTQEPLACGISGRVVEDGLTQHGAWLARPERTARGLELVLPNVLGLGVRLEPAS